MNYFYTEKGNELEHTPCQTKAGEGGGEEQGQSGIVEGNWMA